MKLQNRREFLKTLGLFTGSVSVLNGVTPQNLQASESETMHDKEMGVLVDTTVCIGCRKCEWACKKAHQIPAGKIMEYEDKSVFAKMRRPDEKALTVVNEYENNKTGTIYNAKIQCMHCNHPACVSACIVGAITKKENGAVVWDTNKCIGCRYCMVACPFQIPAFEYHKAIDPRIMKCDFCYDRQKEGKLPACVEICPVEALTFGKKVDVLEEAHRRIKAHPEKYFPHVYGEYEVGGTSWFYLASTDLRKTVLPELGKDPAPGVTEAIQHGLFAYFIPPLALYALLGGIMWLTKSNTEED